MNGRLDPPCGRLLRIREGCEAPRAATQVKGSMGEIYDAVVIGGGHNGLVTGFYLARAGMWDRAGNFMAGGL